MPGDAAKVNEFKRYRQILAALYIGTITAGFALLATSVAKELFFGQVPALPEPIHSSVRSPLTSGDSDPRHIVRCHDDVTALFDELGQFAADELAPRNRSHPDPILHRSDPAGDPVLPLRSDSPTQRWDAFSGGWLERWRATGAWCRFADLANANLGEAYDHIAEVHGRLPSIRLTYQSLLVRFGERHAADLDRVRRDLDRSRQLLLATMKRRQGEEAP